MAWLDGDKEHKLINYQLQNVIYLGMWDIAKLPHVSFFEMLISLAGLPVLDLECNKWEHMVNVYSGELYMYYI